MSENEKEEGGIALSDIFHIIFTQKWILSIILVVITLGGTLGIYYGKNAFSRVYEVSFTLELPKTKVKEEPSTGTNLSASVVYYPDGKPFYYTDMVAIQTLRNIKYSDKNKDKYKNIDVETMSTRGDISVSRSISETAANSGAYEAIYSLTVKASYFPNSDIARDFVTSLTNTPIDYLRLMDINYDVSIASARKAPDYVTEISQLIDQISYIIQRYEMFIEIYSDLSVEGRTLLSYCQDVKSYLNNTAELDILRTEVRKKGYIKSEELKNRYEIELTKLERQYDIASFTLENLKNKGDSESVSAEVFKAQSDLVIELEKEIKEIKEVFMVSNDYGANQSQEHKDFLASLEEAYATVNEFTDEFKEVVSSLYTKVAVVSYSDSNVIVTKGVTGLPMSLAISFIIGLVTSMIVSFIVGWLKKKKASEKTENGEAVQLEIKSE